MIPNTEQFKAAEKSKPRGGVRLKKCEGCGVSFTTRKPDQKFHNSSCYFKHRPRLDKLDKRYESFVGFDGQHAFGVLPLRLLLELAK
jgi:uncharacterized C2H2 Zn-finger protein